MGKESGIGRLRKQLHEIIFEAETLKGKAFDVALLVCILLSVGVVLLLSVDQIRFEYEYTLELLEWVFTLLFTVEYLLRLWVVRKTRSYAFSFYGIIDLLAIIPTYLGLFGLGAESLLVLRILRLLRIFRIFKLAEYWREGRYLMEAMKSSKEKLLIFIGFVLMAEVILGTAMYIIESDAGSGFTSIPRSIYWAIVTLTTVGYGDIAPVTNLGQTLAAVIMLLGYAIIAVPTGIVASEIQKSPSRARDDLSTENCPNCGKEGHLPHSKYCRYCGAKL